MDEISGIQKVEPRYNAVVIQIMDSGRPVVIIECKDKERLPDLEIKARQVYEMLRHGGLI